MVSPWRRNRSSRRLERDQELIAGLMAQAVVDDLEAVKIEEEDGEVRDGPAASSARSPAPGGR